MRDAEQLRQIHGSTRIDAAYSSPYLRARQTIEPIARARGLSIETADDLRERLLSPADLPDWRAHLKRSWNDFDYAPQVEKPAASRRRESCACSTRSRARHKAGTVILASHGNLIALALHAFMPNVDYEFWESIPMPAVFTLIRRRGSVDRLCRGKTIDEINFVLLRQRCGIYSVRSPFDNALDYESPFPPAPRNTARAGSSGRSGSADASGSRCTAAAAAASCIPGRFRPSPSQPRRPRGG